MISKENNGYKTYYLETIEEVEQLFFQQNYDKNIGRYRNLYLYRGMPDKNFKLITSLQRVCKEQKTDIEDSILNNFAKYAEMEEPTIKESVWRKMIIGQHHGIPTRLMDWTKSPLVALHFATTEGNMDLMDQRDCVIWRINVEMMNRNLPIEYKDTISEYNQRIFTVDMLKSVCRRNGGLDNKELEQYDLDMEAEKMVILEPPSIDPRIVNQYSFFSVVPNGVSCIEDVFSNNPGCAERYIINKHLKWQIRDMLDQVNINERVIYPGLDGIATWLGRHYFVRNLNPISIIKDDITKMDVDAIVNPTDEDFVPGKVSEKIYDAAGAELVEELQASDKFKDCHCFITDGYKIEYTKIIHTLSPYNDGTAGAIEKLATAYCDILDLAKAHNCKSIAFPLLGAGYNGFKTETAWKVAIQSCKEFQKHNEELNMDIKFTVVNQKTYEIGKKILETF